MKTMSTAGDGAGNDEVRMRTKSRIMG